MVTVAPWVTTLTFQVCRSTLANFMLSPGRKAFSTSKKRFSKVAFAFACAGLIPLPGLDWTSRFTIHCLRLLSRPSVWPNKIGRTSSTSGLGGPPGVGPLDSPTETPRIGGNARATQRPVLRGETRRPALTSTTPVFESRVSSVRKTSRPTVSSMPPLAAPLARSRAPSFNARESSPQRTSAMARRTVDLPAPFYRAGPSNSGRSRTHVA